MKNIKDISIVENTWRFDDNVANVFDKHVRQSIPHYENLQNYLASIAEWYLKDNSLIYDLGCSTGTTAIKLSKLSIDTNFTLIGYDDNKKMINLAKKKVKKIKKTNGKFVFQKKNILKIKKFKKANLFYSVLLFPFLGLTERNKLLNKISKSLHDDGALISVEKIRSNNSKFEDIFNQLYFDYKIGQNLSHEEILKKAKSLRSSMHLFSETQTKTMLKNNGFKSFDIFFRCFNFIGYIATKN
jgi:tRNA (cmo5U34)-methyltransferase